MNNLKGNSGIFFKLGPILTWFQNANDRFLLIVLPELGNHFQDAFVIVMASVVP